MSRITLASNAAGTGTLTIAAPNTNTDRTLNLPDATTTLVGTDATQTLSNKTIAASQLTGALPALDGSALIGISSMTLLGTIVTTSGATATLSGLNLTSYKSIVAVFNGVSFAAATTLRLSTTAGISISTTLSIVTSGIYGIFQIDLATGVFSSVTTESTLTGNFSATALVQSGIQNTVTNASTSITFGSTSTFDAGSIVLYGVK